MARAPKDNVMTRIGFDEAVAIGLASSEEIEVEKRDPGMFGPFDLCTDCHNRWTCNDDIIHPAYSDWLHAPYTCGSCGVTLTDEDD